MLVQRVTRCLTQGFYEDWMEDTVQGLSIVTWQSFEPRLVPTEGQCLRENWPNAVPLHLITVETGVVHHPLATEGSVVGTNCAAREALP